MMSAIGGWLGLTGRGGATRVATLCTCRLGQCSSLWVISCSKAEQEHQGLKALKLERLCLASSKVNNNNNIY